MKQKKKTKPDLLAHRQKLLRTKKPYWPLSIEWNKALNNLEILISRK